MIPAGGPRDSAIARLWMRTPGARPSCRASRPPSTRRSGQTAPLENRFQRLRQRRGVRGRGEPREHSSHRGAGNKRAPGSGQPRDSPWSAMEYALETPRESTREAIREAIREPLECPGESCLSYALAIPERLADDLPQLGEPLSGAPTQPGTPLAETRSIGTSL